VFCVGEHVEYFWKTRQCIAGEISDRLILSVFRLGEIFVLAIASAMIFIGPIIFRLMNSAIKIIILYTKYIKFKSIKCEWRV